MVESSARVAEVTVADETQDRTEAAVRSTDEDKNVYIENDVTGEVYSVPESKFTEDGLRYDPGSGQYVSFKEAGFAITGYEDGTPYTKDQKAAVRQQTQDEKERIKNAPEAPETIQGEGVIQRGTRG
jgi:hypothetical protein